MLILGLAACRGDAPAGNQTTGNAANMSRPAAPLPIPEPEPALGRAELLAAARSAAGAYAAGRPLPTETAELAGREFVLAIPFGCPGAEPGEAQAGMSWSYEVERERLRLRAEPTIDLESAAAAAATAASGDVEAVEGFWIPRAWTDSEACPPARDAGTPPAIPAAPTPPTIGLAEFFTAADSRTRQRAGRAYESVERIEAADLPGERGFRLVISGRVATKASDRTIACHAPRPDIRPICLIAVEIDRIAFVNPKNGSTLASWEPR